MVRVLIADDDPDALRLTRGILVQAGYLVDGVADAFAAEAHLRATSYDLLISDIEMPGNQDLALIRKLTEISPCTAALLITGFPTVETAMQAVHLPVMAYLTKPCERETLLAKVKEAVARSRALRAIDQSQDRCQLLERQLAQLKVLLAKPGAEGLETSMNGYVGVTLEAMVGSLLDLTAYMETIRHRESASRYGEAILDAIQVLEKTKRSFKSKELGELRQRLAQLVNPAPASSSPAHSATRE